jgi:fatty acid desaturase
MAGIILFFHIGRRTTRGHEPACAFRRQVEGTRNMSTSWLAEFYTGGNNNHIEHHLFPAIPTARLRCSRRITRAFCARHGIDYQETSYFSALRSVIRHLSALSQHVPGAARQS